MVRIRTEAENLNFERNIDHRLNGFTLETCHACPPNWPNAEDGWWVVNYIKARWAVAQSRHIFSLTTWLWQHQTTTTICNKHHNLAMAAPNHDYDLQQTVDDLSTAFQILNTANDKIKKATSLQRRLLLINLQRSAVKYIEDFLKMPEREALCSVGTGNNNSDGAEAASDNCPSDAADAVWESASQFLYVAQILKSICITLLSLFFCRWMGSSWQ